MPKKSTSHGNHYENNPFSVAVSGMTLLYTLARGMAILLLVISVFSFYGSDWTSGRPHDDHPAGLGTLVSSWSVVDWTLAVGSIFVIALAIAMIAALLGGMSAYTSARIARGKKVGIVEAFHASFDNLWAYLWLQIIISIKVLFWSLLLVLPGIYMAIRYSLAGVAFFDEKKQLRGNAAVRESLHLTRNRWVTTFASNTLFNIVTFSIISCVVTTGVNAVLYKQYDRKDGIRPAHWLSWATVFLTGFIGFLLIFIFPLVVLMFLSI